jgi:glycosyltransferase involved in cell wall biosynthesis
MSEKALFAAFDLYPSAKGAATHIRYSAEALFEYMGGGLLYVLGNDKMPTVQEEENGVRIVRFSRPIPNYLERAMAYVAALGEEVAAATELELVHFRDIWSAMAILPQAVAETGKRFKTVFEVNAFASIELPYRYNLSADTLAKIAAIEQDCLQESDVIICPSKVIKSAIVARGIAEEKIKVVSNGAEVVDIADNVPPIGEPYIIYFGALQAWQGVDVLLRGFALLADYEQLRLVVCASNRLNYTKQYRKLAVQLGLENRVIWLHQQPKEVLKTWLAGALFSVAPLRDTPRNTAQGCSPLKIFEAMACAKAVIASDLAVVREILRDGENGKLVRPDRPADLARAMRFLIDFPENAKKIGENAQNDIKNHYTWDKIKGEMKNIYANL